MLEARGITKVYRTGKVSLTVLHDVTLRIEAGAFIAITGPSGAGKSTLLHLFAALDVPTAGEVWWEGRSLSRMSDAERARFRNTMVGIVFQFYHLLPELTTLENVMLPGLVQRRRSRAWLRGKALHCLEDVGLGQRVSHKPTELSGGELQRAAIARALVNEPTVLLCDEPTGNLDSKTGEAIAQLLLQVRQQRGVSLVLVTHEATFAQRADRVITLRDGRIVNEASVAVRP